MSQATVSAYLLQSLKIITEFRVNTVRQYLRVLAIDDVLLSVQKPRRDLELCRVLDDRDNAFQFIRVQVPSTLVEINIGFLADQVGVPTANTLDLSQGVHDFALSINIGVEETENVLKLLVGFG
jgi:hypothetical protein